VRRGSLTPASRRRITERRSSGAASRRTRVRRRAVPFPQEQLCAAPDRGPTRRPQLVVRCEYLGGADRGARFHRRTAVSASTVRAPRRIAVDAALYSAGHRAGASLQAPDLQGPRMRLAASTAAFRNWSIAWASAGPRVEPVDRLGGAEPCAHVLRLLLVRGIRGASTTTAHT
jgi:hypothetical protein